MKKNPVGRPPNPEPLEVVAVKLPPPLVARIRQAAKEDDRTVSAFVRRTLAAVMGQGNDPTPAGH
jgi:hypothetical protein